MKIIVNGVARDVASTTVETALAEIGFVSADVATAHNGEFLAASARGGTALVDGDRLEVLTPAQGG